MTTSLNPNAEVFHSSQSATLSAAIDASSTHWSDPLASDLAVANISTGLTRFVTLVLSDLFLCAGCWSTSWGAGR